MSRDNIFKKFHFVFIKIIFLEIGKNIILFKLIKYQKYSINVTITGVLSIDKNVIEIYYHKKNLVFLKKILLT